MEEQTSTDEADAVGSSSECQRRSVSSAVSYASMDTPLWLKREDTQEHLSLENQKTSNSSELSTVSMRSDMSMDLPLLLNRGNTQIEEETLRTGATLTKNCTAKRTEDNGEPNRKPISRNSGGFDLLGDQHMNSNMFKSNLRNKLEQLHEGTAKHGQSTLLREIYTDLYITESDRGDVNHEHEIRQIETQSRRAETADEPINFRDIFKPEQDKPIRTIMTKGIAGIGKKVFVQKFILDWADGTTNQDIDFIFPLPFKELNLMEGKHLSLSALLNFFYGGIGGAELFSGDYKVLFIFGGLDENRLSLDFHSVENLCDVNEAAPVNVLLMNLIRGNLLPSALIWITSRPAAADLIPRDYVHRVTEIHGFSNAQKEEYFRKRIRDQSLSHRIFSHLQSSRSLFIMCHIPVFCWISATVLEAMFTVDTNAEIPKSLTQMYTRFLLIQISIRQQKDYEDKLLDDREIITKLGKLAFQQLMKGNVIFYEEDLRDSGVDVREASVYSGLCTQIFREEFGLHQGKVFSFVHLSVQEHLAALYVHLSFSSSNGDVSNWFGDNSSLSELHQKVVNEALNSKNGHLDLFLRFLLGLSGKANRFLLTDLETQREMESDGDKETVEFIKEKIRTVNSTEQSVNLFHCLSELGDDSLLQEAQHHLKLETVHETDFSSSQWSAVAFVLLTSETILENFDLKKYVKGNNEAETQKVLEKLLPVIKESRSVQLNNCSVRAEGCSAVASALKSNEHLRVLDLSFNDLGDSGVKLLRDGLKDLHCNLKTLRLVNCGVRAEGCSAVASVLRSNSHLRELNLSHNELGDEGVKLLCDGLKDPCKIKRLWLVNCGVRAEGCSAVASALRSNSHLTKLNLSHNELGDEGVKLLCDGLKDPQCKLKKLTLMTCLKDESRSTLDSLLRKSPHLQLKLSGN